ncbi:PAS domain S-box protein [Sphingomonas sp. CGMCC 1.13654]|uniref:histidine kinase n=1 Tax=Sphingomonas chungangi TaxID=2683589 RepID=A0A838L8W7_9SPHN|nr:PAS domain S-box protein [Sphingomonas chungangi]MBA2934586.1 PAS domain S-box protein [Sphingomonas chungangi]
MGQTGWMGGPEILDLVHDSIIVRAPDGTIIQWNAAAEAQYGWTRAEAVGRPLADLLPLDPPELLAEVDATLLADGGWTGELARWAKDGSQLRIEVRASVRRHDDGRPFQIVETGRDVTEQRANEEAIRLSEYRFRNLFEAMAVSFWEIDFNAVGAMFLPLREQNIDLRSYFAARPERVREMMAATRVLDVNVKTLEMFGAATKEEIVGLGTDRYWPVENYAVFVDSLVAVLEKQPTFVRETSLYHHSGRRLDVMFTVAWSPETRKRGVVTLGVIDITDRLDAERKLQQIQADYIHAARIATLGELTASIAHEVNQPLAAIVTNGETSLRWLDRAEPNAEEARQLAFRMVADARRAADVIQRIRGMATRTPAGRTRQSINEIVSETLDFLRRDLQSSDVRVHFDAATGLPYVDADRTQLQQVLVNLAVNAKQAMVQHGRPMRILAIRTSLSGSGQIKVEIEDNGPGISPAIADHLFDSFATTKADGLGIGLSICRSIVEDHGGEIRALNGETGACFAFTLPAALASDEQPN